MAFRGALSDEQKARIVCEREVITRTVLTIKEANRKRAAERMNKKNGQVHSSSTPVTALFVTMEGKNVRDPKRPRIELTPDQKKRIEENRKKALERQQQLNQNNRDATTTQPEKIPIPDNIRLNHNNKNDSGMANNSNSNSRYEPPAIQRKDYIEFDFATMIDTRGGFIGEESEGPKDGETLDEWKDKKQVIYDPAPPLDVRNAPKCYECGLIEIDQNLYKNFREVRACRRCIKEKPEKYSLLTKTECREDYLLTDPELRDVLLLARIEKPNPHGYSRMQLFLRFQVEEFAWKKWGSSDKLDEEWEKRETMRIKRRDKKYNDQLLEMRKKTRAEEYTRKLRNGQGIGERHVHDWSAPLSIKGETNMVKKRCIDCGVEMEEIII